MVEIPRIISVDDHVVEPPDLWTSRLPSRYAGRTPHIVRDRAKFSYLGGVHAVVSRKPCDGWARDRGG
jgi:hypothetical protein